MILIWSALLRKNAGAKVRFQVLFLAIVDLEKGRISLDCVPLRLVEVWTTTLAEILDIAGQSE